MWKRFCRYVVDIENDYFEQDDLVEDIVEEFANAAGKSSTTDDCNNIVSMDDSDQLDDNDRLLFACLTENSFYLKAKLLNK